MTKKTIIFICAVLGVIALAAGAYWYFVLRGPTTPSEPGGETINGFQPFGRTPTTGITNGGTGSAEPTGSTEVGNETDPIPTLRLLSSTPVGGYGIGTTASTTIIRWIDRGRGNVYEVESTSRTVETLSNTIVPRMYMSLWNKNADRLIGAVIENNTEASTLYAELIARPQTGIAALSTSTASSTTPSLSATTTPFELKGRSIPGQLIGMATSPLRDKIFLFMNENGRGVGYTTTFGGSSLTKIFDTPLTQAVVEWPEAGTIALTTKASADQDGYLYFINPLTGAWKKALGPLRGLTTKVSRDAQYIAASSVDASGRLRMDIYPIGSTSPMSAVVRTVADKCVWGSFYKNILYCAVPNQLGAHTYPDDWHAGFVSFTDKIWQIDARSGEVKLIASLLDGADRVIDAFELGIDGRDDYLVFMNKSDLSLWSLDLVASP